MFVAWGKRLPYTSVLRIVHQYRRQAGLQGDGDAAHLPAQLHHRANPQRREHLPR
jgi:hypothetical protein